MLVSVGWKYEGIGWYSVTVKAVALYRLYNPNTTGPGAHHYTVSIVERNYLVKIGWKYEGIGWYGTNDSGQTSANASYESIMNEYKNVAKSNFNQSVINQSKYVNEGVNNYIGGKSYSVYYQLLDMAGDGKPELLIAINKANESKRIVDVYSMKDGKPIRLIENDTTVGYRTRYYIDPKRRIMLYGSGGALNIGVKLYKVPANGASLKLEDQYIYNGWYGDKYTHIDANNNSTSISKTYFDNVINGAMQETEKNWKLLY